MRSFIVLAMVLFVASSAFAERIVGTLSVDSGNLRVKRDDNLKVRFYKGKYKTSFEMSGRKGFFFIERKGIQTIAEFRLPRDFRYPENGNFYLPAEKTGQTFHFGGTVKTTKSKSENFEGYEGCTYYEEEYVCRRDRWGDRYCRWEEVAYRGEQRVEFYFLKWHRKLNLKFNKSSKIRFSGQRSKKEKVYTFRGECL